MTIDKWEFIGQNPEGKKYFKRIRVKKPKACPEPPPNFTPNEEFKTFSEDNPPILTGAQGYSQAMEKKEN
ncbi:MAG: hypothetical protein Q7T59_03035 [Candidatus Woesebacteria bacterium]|nr:hypothetical protein [Candidatus Woesebacteria bacterium]